LTNIKISDRYVQCTCIAVSLFYDLQSSFLTGIACISLSIVDERGNQIRIFNCPKPARTGYTRFHNTDEFDNLVTTELYTATPGPKPGISQFQFYI